MKRTAAVVGALGLTLGLGAGAATANAQVVPAPAAAEATPEVLPGQVGTGSMVIDTIERAANEEDAAGAIMTATGEMTAEGLRECGLGMLIGTTTEEFTPRNVGTFLTVAGKRLVAIAQGPAAVVSVVAGGCVERALLNAYDVPAGSAKISGSVASLALGGLLGTGLLATASSDTGLLDAASSGTGSDTASSDAASADTASSDTASSDTGSAGLFDSGSLEASAPISDSLLAGSAGA